MRSRVAHSSPRGHQRRPPSIPQHVPKSKTSPKDLFLRFSQATLSRSRFPSEELRNRSHRPCHPHPPSPNPNALRVRMEVLPRQLSVAMGEGRRSHRCEPVSIPTRNSLTPAWTSSSSELAVFGMLLANILQASVALRSPPAPYPPVPSPAKALSPPRQPSSTTTANWRSNSTGLASALSLSDVAACGVPRASGAYRTWTGRVVVGAAGAGGFGLGC